MPFYAVAKGRQEGVYTTWGECQQQVNKFSGAIFKKFPSLSEATDYLIQQQAIILRDSLNKEAAKGLRKHIPLSNELAMNIKQEPDYIPLQAKAMLVNIKEEDQSDSVWFEDAVGDKELLAALGALKEYPDEKPKPLKAETHIKQEARKPQCLKIGRYLYNVDEDGYVDVYVGGHSENVGSWNCMAGCSGQQPEPVYGWVVFTGSPWLIYCWETAWLQKYWYSDLLVIGYK